MARVLKILIASLILFMPHVGAWAQMPIKLQVAPQVDPDSVDLAYYGKKHFWRAAGTVVGFNIGLWAFDRYVQNGDFARISLHSVKENFKHGFKWDNDKLGTNMFLHPYNGNLFYNAARSNVTTTGSRGYLQSEEARCGKCLWNVNIRRPTTS